MRRGAGARVPGLSIASLLAYFLGSITTQCLLRSSAQSKCKIWRKKIHTKNKKSKEVGKYFWLVYRNQSVNSLFIWVDIWEGRGLWSVERPTVFFHHWFSTLDDDEVAHSRTRGFWPFDFQQKTMGIADESFFPSFFQSMKENS